ncbi:hypothetical protein KKA14_16045 [bacterium]|nr:hypothetical protein [bacterium]
MKKVTLSTICIFLFCLVSSALFADQLTITLDRVRYKKSWLSWTEHPAYPEWQGQGIWTEYRKLTFISRYWVPSVANTKTMILVMAGQQKKNLRTRLPTGF